MSKTALVTGISGQDGAYLGRLLLEKGYKVFGCVRTVDGPNHRLADLGIEDSVEFVPFDLSDFKSVTSVIEEIRPDELYNLAAQSSVGRSWQQPLETVDAGALGVCRILEALRMGSKGTQFYQASTSEMFGLAEAVPLNEKTYFHPRSPYGVAKAFGHGITVNYRESFGIHASSGILFNHDSPLRGTDFVTRKISLGLARIRHGEQEILELGNLSAQRDWGYAGDFVKGMWQMLQRDVADDYVLATGVATTVRSFAEMAGATLGFDIIWEGSGENERGRDSRTGAVIIVVNPALYRPAEVNISIGNAAKARAILEWSPSVMVKEIAEMMARADYDRVAPGFGQVLTLPA